MLYLVGVPVGNWQDMPLRNIDLIKEAKNLIVENEPNFKKILKQLNIDKTGSNIMYIETNGLVGIKNENILIEQTLNLLKAGEDVYIISDQGMPGISDPGEMITREAIKHGFPISATPGPSSIIAMVSVAGCQHNFSFEGFLSQDPEERGRCLQIKGDKTAPMIFLLVNNSLVSRVCETLNHMIEKWGDRNGVLCYNLTIEGEEVVIRGRLSYLSKYHKKREYPGGLVSLVVDGNRPMLTMPEV